MIYILLLTTSTAFAQQSSQPEREQSATTRLDLIIPAITTIVGIVVGGIITALLTPRVKEKFVLREQYLVPFKKWCSEAYGDLNEFEKRYIKNKDTLNKISNIQIILDFRSLHESLIHAPIWIAKIKKEEKSENSEVVKNIRKLLEVVEVVWHALEDEHGNALRSAESIKEFNQGLKCLKPEKRKEIADQIRNHLRERPDVYSTETFKPILNFLLKHVP